MGPSNLGPLTPYHPPAMGALQGYAVNREGQNEVIWQPAYDYQAYPVGGATQFTFFQTTVGTGGSTLADTNMRASGQFPAPQEFLCTGIQVFFNPGGAIGQDRVAVIGENWNDVNEVMQGDAWLELFIGSKPYLDDGPLSKFTQQFRLGGVAAISNGGDPTVDESSYYEYAVHCGKYYAITPVKIPKNQNFNVTLNFPAAIPVDAEAKIGVILDGFLYRLSQ